MAIDEFEVVVLGNFEDLRGGIFVVIALDFDVGVHSFEDVIEVTD